MLPKIFGIVTLRGSWPEPCPGSPCPTLSRPPRPGGTRSGVRGVDGGVMIGRARTRVKPTFPIPARGTGVKATRRPKDRDFVETREGFFFCLVGYVHPPDRYLAYLKYTPAAAGKW